MYVPDRTSLFGNCRICDFKALSIFSVGPFRNAEISPQNIRPDLHYFNSEKKFQELNFNQIEKKELSTSEKLYSAYEFSRQNYDGVNRKPTMRGFCSCMFSTDKLSNLFCTDEVCSLSI